MNSDAWIGGYIDRMPSGPKLASDLLARMLELDLRGGRVRPLAYHMAMLAQEAGALLVLLRDTALEAGGAGEAPARAAAETRAPLRRHARAVGRLARALGLTASTDVGEEPGAELLGAWLAGLDGIRATGAPPSEAEALAHDVHEAAAGCARLLWRVDRALAERAGRRELEAALAGAAREWGPRGPVYERLFGGRDGPGLYRRLRPGAPDGDGDEE